MIRPVYALLDSCTNELVRIAWSIHGAVIDAVVENPDLVFDDGSPLDLAGLKERLCVASMVHFYVHGDPNPVGRVERHQVGA